MTFSNKLEKKNETAQQLPKVEKALQTNLMEQQASPEKALKDSSKQNLSQREVVFEQVKAFLKEKNLKVEKNKPALDLLKKEDLLILCNRIVKDFESGKATFRKTESNDKKLADKKELFKYCSGLLMNWLRRDPRLNGAEEFPST